MKTIPVRVQLKHHHTLCNDYWGLTGVITETRHLPILQRVYPSGDVMDTGCTKVEHFVEFDCAMPRKDLCPGLWLNQDYCTTLQ